MRQKQISKILTRWYFKFCIKNKFSQFENEVDKLNIEKLALVSVDLSKLSDIVKNAAVKKAVYEKLAAKVNNVDTSEFVLKTKYQTGKTKLEKKIPDATDFVKKTKLTELEDKIRDVSSLATKTALTTVENKIPDINGLVKKNYNIKISQIKKNIIDHDHDKYITTSELNSLAANVFNTKLAQANLVTKTNFDTIIENLLILLKMN